MFNAAKSFAALSELLASVSTNLSIALVLGLAALPVIPHDYAPAARASAPPAPPADTKPDTAQAEPPKPDVWTEAEVIAGLRECVRLLAPIAADVEVSEPVKHEQCGTPAPVALRRIGSGANRIEINPPATIN